MITPFLAGSRGWGPELGESGKLGVGPGAAARSGHHACLPVCLLPSSLACATSRTHLPFGPGGLRSSSHMGPLKTESSPRPRPPCSLPDVSVWGWRTAVLSTPGGASPSGPASPPLPALPGSVSAQALAPAADPPRYTFAPSASLNKTARPFGAPLPADSALQQNGYVGPAHPLPSPPPTPSV